MHQQGGVAAKKTLLTKREKKTSDLEGEKGTSWFGKRNEKPLRRLATPPIV